MKATFIYEFGFRSDDAMMPSLIEALEREIPGLKHTYIHGVFSTYKPGGLRPQRLANLAWVYLRVVFHLVFNPPDVVFVRTTPPCVQLWVNFWAKLRRVPTICWLMDYHPEMEARVADRKGWRGLAGFLRRVDRWLIKDFRAIVPLDEAMAQLCRQRAPGVPLLVHPTWGNRVKNVFLPVAPQPEAGVLRLAYAGNFGAAHDARTLEDVMRELAKFARVELHVIGAPPQGEELLRAIAQKTNATFFSGPRVSFSELGNFFARSRIDVGIVLLADESAGLVSPSKFSGYVTYGVPVLYIGPPLTNSDRVCREFHGGWALRNQASPDDVTAITAEMLREDSRRNAAAALSGAAEYFGRSDGESLAKLLLPFFQKNSFR